MGNWIPNDPTLVAQILKISAAYSPPMPEGFISPMTWGVESNVIERFAGAGVPKRRSHSSGAPILSTFPAPHRGWSTQFRRFYGPTMNAFDAAEKNGRAGVLQNELEALFNGQNKSPSNDATSSIRNFLARCC